MKLHEMLDNARKARGLSHDKLGALTGLGNITVFNIMRGKTVEPSFYKVVLLAEQCGVTLNKLATSEMERWAKPAQRKRMSKRMQATLADPKNADALAAGRNKAVRKMNKTVTYEQKLAAIDAANKARGVKTRKLAP